MENTTITHLENALSYSNQHGKDGKWSYELLLEATEAALRELDPDNHWLPQE